jgi:hypothetical protein
MGAPVKTLVSELEGQINEAKDRLADLEKVWPLNGRIIDDQDALRRIIRELESKRAVAKRNELSVLFGLPAHEDVTAKRLASKSLTMPQRIFEERERKQHVSRLNSEDDASREFQNIRDEFWNADAQARVEDKFQKALRIFIDGKSNREAAYTQGTYGSFICVLALMQCEMDALREFSGIKRREMEARIVALEQDREQLKTQLSNFKYCGTWNPNHIYAKGNSVTQRGSLWIALKDNGLEPGGNDAWQLAVKRGKDAK